MGYNCIIIFICHLFYKNKLKYQKINEKLQIAKNEAIHANRSKSIFISKMSHELRTPLNAILGFSSLLLQDNTLKSNDKKALKTINSSGSFLLNLINDILDISSIESNKIILQENTINMKNILNDIVLLVQSSAEAKSLKLDVKYENNGIECIKTDDKLIRQILLNLITNSIKYSKKGTITIYIKLKAKHILIKISDEGAGISQDDLKYIFEPFKQVGEASSSTGSGLGLAIVKQFIDTMNGDISVKSILGKGTTFSLDIPYKKCTYDDTLELNNTTITKNILGVTKDTKPIKILIAEDKENNILLLKMILNILNFEIQVAHNGEEAIEQFKSFKPDLIFMDKRMPKMDGLEATKNIRQLNGGDSVKIVMLSANTTTEKPPKEIAPDEFILKPYKTNDIYNVISKYFDVNYIYEKTDEKDDNNINKFSHENFKKHLQKLDNELLDELYKSSVLLSHEDTRVIINKIKIVDKELYKMLKQLIDEINFMDILNTIDEIRE